MHRVLSIIVLAAVTLSCSGQAFLSKYDKLNRKNLQAFFSDWEVYSDSVRLNNVITDSVMASVLECEYAENPEYNYGYSNRKKPKYIVYPQELTVHRFCFDSDTLNDDHVSWFNNISESEWNQQTAYDITPYIPMGGLYLTNDIYKILSEFLGGLLEKKEIQVNKSEDKEDEDDDEFDDDEYMEFVGETYSKINKGNHKRLSKYIQAVYDHWGGYWWFTTFPAILDIYYANDVIFVNKKYTFSTGKGYEYRIKDGKFVKDPKPVMVWWQ